MNVFKKIMKIIYIVITSVCVLGLLVAATVFNPHFKPTTLRNLMKEAQLAIGAEDYLRAADYCRLAINLDPGYIDAYLLLGDATVLYNYPEDAIYYIKKRLDVKDNKALRESYTKLLSIAEYNAENNPSSGPVVYTPTPAPSPPAETIVPYETPEPSPETPVPDGQDIVITSTSPPPVTEEDIPVSASPEATTATPTDISP